MPRTKPLAARRRAEQQMRRIADEFRLAKARTGLPNPEIARRAGVVPSTVRRVESGTTGIGVRTLVAVMAATGVDLVLKAYPSPGFELRDTRHAQIAEILRAMASPRRRVQAEAPAGEHGESADLLIAGPDELLHMEIERNLVDLQAQLRSALRKREFLAARDNRPVRLVLVVEDTTPNRDRWRAHAAFINSQLPAGSREILRSLRSGQPLSRDGLLWIRRRSTGAAPKQNIA